MIPLLLLVVASLILGRGFYSVIRKRDQRAPQEVGLHPRFEVKCGVQLDTFGCTWPFARLSLYETFLVLSSERGTFILRYPHIERVEIERTLAGPGLRIRHTEKEVPQSVLVWSDARDEICGNLSLFRGGA